MNPETCGYFHEGTHYCEWTPEGVLVGAKTCGMINDDPDKRFCFAEKSIYKFKVSK